MKYIELSKKSYPVLFSMFVLAEFGKLTGLAMGQLFESLGDVNKLELMHIYQLAYCGFRAGARKEKQDFNYTLEEFALLLDDNEGWMDQVFEVLADSLPQAEEKKSKTKAPVKK